MIISMEKLIQECDKTELKNDSIYNQLAANPKTFKKLLEAYQLSNDIYLQLKQRFNDNYLISALLCLLVDKHFNDSDTQLDDKKPIYNTIINDIQSPIKKDE